VICNLLDGVVFFVFGLEAVSELVRGSLPLKEDRADWWERSFFGRLAGVDRPLAKKGGTNGNLLVPGGQWRNSCQPSDRTGWENFHGRGPRSRWI